MAATVHASAPVHAGPDSGTAGETCPVEDPGTEISADQPPSLTSKAEHPCMTTPALVFVGEAAAERAECIEVLASAAYLRWCEHRAEESTWADCTGATRERYLEHAEMLADALAAAGRLVIAREERATWIASDGHRAYDERPRSYWGKRMEWPGAEVEYRGVTEWRKA